MFRLLMVAFLVVGAAGDAMSQVVRPGIVMPPRDGTGAAAQTGTGRIRGRVVTADGGAPLRRAQVTIMAPDVSVRRMTTTDGEGRYEFAQLPAARYTISAGKGGYVTLQVGQKRPFEPGTPVTLADGQALTDVDVALPRGAVIAGRVTDEFGEPLAGVMVNAMRYQFQPGGQRQLSFAGGAFVQTDDLGQFRVYGLMPGAYVVSATLRQLNFGIGMANATDNAEGYPPTYYPSTANVAEAQTVNVGVAQETTVAITLQAARMARVSGTVVDSQGRPAVGSMVVLRSGSGAAVSATMVNGQVGADGAFSLANVPPGEHVVQIQPRPRGPDAPVEMGSAAVTVGGEDINGLRITLAPAGIIRGRVVFEGTAARTFGFGPLRFFPQTVDGSPGAVFFGGGNASDGTVNEDGTFEIGGVSGRVLIRAALGGNWTLKSVTFDGDDITDVPLDMRAGRAVSGVRVVLTDKVSRITGAVQDDRNRPLKDYVVVAIPEQMPEGTAATRHMRTARPDQDGRFTVRGLPPGRYHVAAVEALEQGQEWDPEVQRRVRDAGRPVTLAEGESLALDLKLTGGI